MKITIEMKITNKNSLKREVSLTEYTEWIAGLDIIEIRSDENCTVILTNSTEYRVFTR